MLQCLDTSVSTRHSRLFIVEVTKQDDVTSMTPSNVLTASRISRYTVATSGAMLMYPASNLGRYAIILYSFFGSAGDDWTVTRTMALGGCFASRSARLGTGHCAR